MTTWWTRARVSIPVGGAEAVTWPTLLLYALPSFWVNFFFDRTHLGGDHWLWLGYSCALYCATIAPLIVARYTVLPPVKNPHLKPGSLPHKTHSTPGARVVVTVAVYVVAAACRATVLATLGTSVQLVPADEVWLRVLVTPVNVIVWLTIIAALVDGATAHRRAIRRLLAQRAELQVRYETLHDEIAQHAGSLRDHISQALAPTLEWLGAVDRGSSSRSPSSRYISTEVVGGLRSTIDQVVRPLSDNLVGTPPTPSWSERVNIPPRQRFTLPRQVSLRSVNAPGGIALLTLYCAFIPGLMAYGLQTVTLLIFPVTALIWGCGALLNRLDTGRPHPLQSAVGVVIAVYAGLGLLGATYGLMLRPDIPLSVEIQFCAVLIFMTLVTMAFRVTRIGLIDAEAALVTANNELERLNAEFRQQLWVMRTDLATVLHGPVQASLQVLAMRLAEHPDMPDEEFERAVVRISEAMELLNRPQVISEKQFMSALENVASMWSQLAQVTQAIDPRYRDTIDSSPGTARCVLEIVRESVTNAIKHGGASLVHVDIKLQGQAVLVQVTNDGGDYVAGSTGFGHRMFDDVCLEWQLENLPEGTRLRAVVPVSRDVFG